MKSDVITVTNSETNMEEVLEQVEKVASFKNLSHKDALHLRLLTEEAMGMMRSVAGEVKGKFWIEDEQDLFRIHLQADKNMSAEQREQLISASSSGKNEAARGFMGKIRTFFEPLEDFPLIIDVSGIDSPNIYADISWSMRAYERQIQKGMEQNRKGAAEAWDELEKSVISHIADDVKVSILGRDVEMVIEKKIN